MAIETPSQTDAASEGSSLADSLRACLAPAILTLHHNGRVILTPQARRLLAFPEEQSSDVVSKNLPEALLELATDTLQNGRPVNGRTFQLKLRDGSQKNLQASSSRIGSGPEAFVVVALNDLAALERIEGPLLQADRLANLGSLAAGMAHEIKNALVPCKTFIDLLLEKNPESELAELVQREIKRMHELVSRVLRVSAPPAPVRAPVRLHEIIELSLRVLEPQFAAKALTVHRAFEAAPDVTQGSANELQQALMNLLLNAFDALAEDGIITIRTRLVPGVPPQRSEILVAVEDNGSGIPAEIRGRLFEPFFTTKPDGTGLGLTITRRIIKAHQGRIAVEPARGKGTVFTLFLPA